MSREGTTAGLRPVPSHQVNLNEVLARSVEARNKARNTREIAFTLDLAQDLPRVCIAPQEIESILRTLIGNAEDAIGEDLGRPGQIHIKTALQGQRVQVSLMDNGRGIHWRDMARLFGDQSRDVALTRCAEVVKDNGGDLYAWSNYGNGSVFTLELPIQVRPQDGYERGLRGKRILVIDDEIHVSTLLFDVLQNHGAQIDLANSGIQAVERIKSKQYDLFICDQRMPDLSGEHLYRSVESMNPALGARFLFVTGDALNDETQDFFTQTGVQYIQKPFRTVELVAAAEQVLSRSQRIGF
jgi:CheY-like chemotaxis protein